MVYVLVEDHLYNKFLPVRLLPEYEYSVFYCCGPNALQTWSQLIFQCHARWLNTYNLANIITLFKYSLIDWIDVLSSSISFKDGDKETPVHYGTMFSASS